MPTPTCWSARRQQVEALRDGICHLRWLLIADDTPAGLIQGTCCITLRTHRQFHVIDRAERPYAAAEAPIRHWMSANCRIHERLELHRVKSPSGDLDLGGFAGVLLDRDLTRHRLSVRSNISSHSRSSGRRCSPQIPGTLKDHWSGSLCSGSRWWRWNARSFIDCPIPMACDQSLAGASYLLMCAGEATNRSPEVSQPRVARAMEATPVSDAAVLRLVVATPAHVVTEDAPRRQWRIAAQCSDSLGWRSARDRWKAAPRARPSGRPTTTPASSRTPVRREDAQEEDLVGRLEREDQLTHPLDPVRRGEARRAKTSTSWP